MNKLKVWFFHSEDSAVGYYRLWQPQEWLNKLGLAEVKRATQATKMPFEITPGKDSIASVGEWADIFVFQRIDRVEGLAVIEAIRAKFNKPVIYEVDDNLFAIPKTHPQYEVFRQKGADEVFDRIRIKAKDLPLYKGRDIALVTKLDNDELLVAIKKSEDIYRVNEYALSTADAVFTTTEMLAKAYRKFNKNIYVLKNCIDFDLWDSVPAPEPNKNIVIGWAGGGQHRKDLDMIAPAIEQVLIRNPDVEFHWSNCYAKKLLALKEKYPDRITLLDRVSITDWHKGYKGWGFDIALAPIQDIEFDRCKSNLKWLENSACKIPTVASPVTPYMCIKHGETGFLANETAEWVDCIETLIKDPALRRRIGQAAYDEVKRDYNAKDNAKNYAKALTEVHRNYIPKPLESSNDGSMGLTCEAVA